MKSLTGLAKGFLRRQLAATGREIVPRIARNGPELSVLGILLEYCSRVEGKGAVVQIGANDGVMNDPVRESILSLGLPALLVEPLPDVFARLKANYGGRSNVIFENAAVSTVPGEADIYRVSATADHLPSWVQGLASFDRSVLLKHREWEGVRGNPFEAHIESIRVPVLTVQQLLGRHPELGRLLALQVDTEGHDYKVIQSAVDAGALPSIINYEHKHLGYEDQVACRDLLTSRGYAFFGGTVDTLAFRAPVAP